MAKFSAARKERLKKSISEILKEGEAQGRKITTREIESQLDIGLKTIRKYLAELGQPVKPRPSQEEIIGRRAEIHARTAQGEKRARIAKDLQLHLRIVDSDRRVLQLQNHRDALSEHRTQRIERVGILWKLGYVKREIAVILAKSESTINNELTVLGREHLDHPRSEDARYEARIGAYRKLMRTRTIRNLEVWEERFLTHVEKDLKETFDRVALQAWKDAVHSSALKGWCQMICDMRPGIAPGLGMSASFAQWQWKVFSERLCEGVESWEALTTHFVASTTLIVSSYAEHIASAFTDILRTTFRRRINLAGPTAHERLCKLLESRYAIPGQLPTYGQIGKIFDGVSGARIQQLIGKGRRYISGENMIFDPLVNELCSAEFLTHAMQSLPLEI